MDVGQTALVLDPVGHCLELLSGPGHQEDRPAGLPDLECRGFADPGGGPGNQHHTPVHAILKRGRQDAAA